MLIKFSELPIPFGAGVMNSVQYIGDAALSSLKRGFVTSFHRQ